MPLLTAHSTRSLSFPSVTYTTTTMSAASTTPTTNSNTTTSDAMVGVETEMKHTRGVGCVHEIRGCSLIERPGPGKVGSLSEIQTNGSRVARNEYGIVRHGGGGVILVVSFSSSPNNKRQHVKDRMVLILWIAR